MTANATRRPLGFGCVSTRLGLRIIQALLFAFCLLSALGSAQARIVTVTSADPATVQNVQVADFYGHSVVLRWNKPATDGAVPTSGYYLTWQVAGQTAFESKVAAASSGLNAFQIQPLDPTKTYTVTIAPLTMLGQIGKVLTLTNISPKGQYEALIKQYTNNGLNGFLYLPENDPVNGRINPLKINNNVYALYAGSANGTYFDHSSVAVNNQQHWHMIANDYGTGAITSRIKAAIPVDANTRALVWDCDGGPYARQTWYIVLTPNKVEQFLLFPNNGDASATGVYPLEQIQIKFDGVNARIYRYSGGNLVAQATFNWRQTIYTNVRQIMSMDINSAGLKFYADTTYSGQLVQTGAFASDLSAWKSCYAYFTLGSYNNRKFNQAWGISATGQKMQDFQGGNMHWGNITLLTPNGIAPPAELSYFQQANLWTRDAAMDLSAAPPLTITIPDPIPADAVARELVFTDRNGCIPCLSGTNKLRLSVNGTVLPNKKEAEAWSDYPTYRWQIPAGILKQGTNTIVFGQTGTPDPIGISSLHIDIHVPISSPAVAAYTAPPPTPIVETMPDHTELEGWTIPNLTLTFPTVAAKGVISLPLAVGATDAMHLAGNPVPINNVWAEINGKKFWSQDLNAAGVGSNGYNGTIPLDTTKYPDGYYEIMARANSKSGSQAYSNGSNTYAYDPATRLLIVNAPANTTAPKFTSVTMTTGSPAQTIAVSSAAPYYIRRHSNYVWNFSIQSRNPLLNAQQFMKDANGVFQPFRSYSPAFATTTTPGGYPVYTFGDGQAIEDWWPVDGNGQNVFLLTTTDVYGNTAQYQYAWSLIVSPPAPPAPATSLPGVSQFSASPQAVASGWACQLQWNVSGAATVTIDNGIGSVGASGKVCVTPTKATTYTLTATNSLGTVTKSTTVTITP